MMPKGDILIQANIHTCICGTKMRKQWGCMLQPTASDSSWKFCSYMWKVGGQSSCCKNFVGMGNFRCWTFDQGTKTETKLISHRLFRMMEGLDSLSVYFSTVALGWNRIFRTLTPFSELNSSFRVSLVLDVTRLQIITVWVFFIHFTSFKMC